ncbi:unnamed protein product [Allacma fusca]|uniref:PLAT domain-containing protein n=1 Tax=Allacma fusca TaxID=39272 RepID=A0A8J2P129_9HEXA|nr:unnamed protein product [Allacma fusca]
MGKNKDHRNFLRNLEISLIVTLTVLLMGMIALHFVGVWQYRKRKRRWNRDMISVVVDEQEGGDAQYLVTIVTRSDYRKPTTATTTIHLIGGVFPGRIHDITRCKIRQKYPLFAPLCRERIVLQEDTQLDPIIGLVIKTNHVGSHPTWNCRYIIVRNLKTDNAWHFNLKNEVGYGRCIEATESLRLVSLSHAFSQRLLQECKHGQHVIFGPYFYEPTSAYSLYQRITVMIIAHLCLVSFTLLSLCTTLPIGQAIDSINRNISAHKHTAAEQAFQVSLEDETALSVWFCTVWPSALLAGLITTVLGFIMNLHFRERNVYETGFSEMDYVVATALRDISLQKRELLQKAEARESTFEAAKEIVTAKSLQETTLPSDGLDLVAGIGLEALPFAVLRKLSPKGARDRQRHMFIGGKYLKDPRFSQYLNLPPLGQTIGDIPNKTSARKTHKKSSPRVKLTPSSTPGLSAKNSELTVINGDKRLKHFFSAPVIKSPNYSSFKIGSSVTSLLQEKNQLLAGELDPRKFRRSFFKPVVAWIISGAILLLSFLSFLIMGPIGATATVEADLFTLIFITTYFVAMLALCFVFETTKISLIAFFYAYNDWKLYQLIQKRCIIPKDLGFQYKL